MRIVPFQGEGCLSLSGQGNVMQPLSKVYGRGLLFGENETAWKHAKVRGLPLTSMQQWRLPYVQDMPQPCLQEGGWNMQEAFARFEYPIHSEDER